MIMSTTLTVVVLITIGLAYLIGHAEGRNKGHDVEDEAFAAGHREGWKNGSQRFTNTPVTDANYDLERKLKGSWFGKPIPAERR